MSASEIDRAVELPLDGPAAPPRSNGELAFDEPWQGRSMALAVHLCERGTFRWSDFQQALIRRIAEWERLPERGDYRYWDHWQSALEDVLDGPALAAESVALRALEITQRPHGWDHE
ncbi:MAG: nitrile hydratase accessory protein [Acidobacteriota bacterium]